MSDPFTQALVSNVMELRRMIKRERQRTRHARASRDMWRDRARAAERAQATPYMRRRVRDLEDQLLRLNSEMRETNRREMAA
jgi:hypothetical protein